MMQRRAEAGLLDAIEAYFYQVTPGLGTELETYQCSEWGEYQREKTIASMHYLNDVLSQNTYLAGEQFSMADITAFAGLAFAGCAMVEIPVECDHLIAWRERVSQRSSLAG